MIFLSQQITEGSPHAMYHNPTEHATKTSPNPSLDLAASSAPEDEVPPYRFPELEPPEFVAVVDAAVAVAVDDGVITGPGPSVIMSPFPPGYVAPAGATKLGGTLVSLLAKKYMAAAGLCPKFDRSKNSVRLK
jgi:hypothetical protein